MIYDGGIAQHHFRDFACCDSGVISWLLLAELFSQTGRPLSDWERDRFQNFPFSEKINFCIKNACLNESFLQPIVQRLFLWMRPTA
jgi:phosphomannomutase